MNIGIFSGPCGQNSSATSVAGLPVNAQIQLNGNIDLSGCVQFNDGGCVYSVTLVPAPGFYDYQLLVDAQGPSGIFSGSGYLNFTDATGDTYALSIYSSTRSVHNVRYNSSNPTIMSFTWSNTSSTATQEAKAAALVGQA